MCSSLKTEPASFRSTVVPPKLCVTQEVRREKGKLCTMVLSQWARQTYKLPWADGPGAGEGLCTPERTSGYLLWSPGPVFTAQSPNGGHEEERSNC